MDKDETSPAAPYNNAYDLRRQAMADALRMAEINRNAECQRILSDAKKILSFYEKGPVE